MTSIVGKDAPLENSICKMQGLLQSLGFEIEEVNWLNPVPHVWSVHIRDKHCPQLFTNGKGATREAARASALGEYLERLSCNYFFADYYLGKQIANNEFVHYPNERWFPLMDNQIPAGLLDEATLSHYNMEGNLTARMLVDTNSGYSERGICALPFIKQKTGDRIWFPVNIIGNLYVSNGMAAGNTRYEARVQALSEIFERHIKNTILSSGISLPRIPDEVIAGYPSVNSALAALRAQGLLIYVLDASLGGKFPLVNVTLLNPENGGCFASFGAHPKFEVALERTVTELLQGRELDTLGSFPEPSFDLQQVADQHNLETHFIDSSGVVAWDLFSNKPDYPFTPWNIPGDTQAEFEHLCRLIERVDMDIYIADYEHLGFYSCRIIVPGMSEIYPVEELVWNNNNQGASLREALLTLPGLQSSQAVELLEQLDALALDDAMLVAELAGVVPDPGSWLDGFRLGELRCLLSLLCNDLEAALECSEWLALFGELQGERKKLHQCLYQLLQLECCSAMQVEELSPVLADLYGEHCYRRALDLLQGQGVFDHCQEVGLSLAGCTRHQAMLDVYQRLQAAKACYNGTPE